MGKDLGKLGTAAVPVMLLAVVVSGWISYAQYVVACVMLTVDRFGWRGEKDRRSSSDGNDAPWPGQASTH